MAAPYRNYNSIYVLEAMYGNSSFQDSWSGYLEESRAIVLITDEVIVELEALALSYS